MLQSSFTRCLLIDTAYALGGLGLLIDVGINLIHNHQRFKQASIVNAGIWSAQYLCLGALSASFTLLVAMVRTWLSEKAITTNQKIVLFLSANILFFGAGLLSWQGAISLFPVLALGASTYALTFRDNLTMRKDLFLISGLWLANDLYWHAYLAVGSNLLSAIFNVWSIYHLDKAAKQCSAELADVPILHS